MGNLTLRELRNASAAVMDAVERGETFRITRHGTVVAERVGNLMRGKSTWPREHIGGGLANLTHLAYLLGAVRQMLRVARG